MTVRPVGVGVEPGHLGVDEQRDVGPVEDRAHGDRLGVGLGVDQARVAVAPRAADARALGPVGLVEQDAARGVERVVAAGGHLVGELLDAWLVRDGRPRVRLGPRPLGGVLAGVAVDLVQLLGLGVPRLEVVVGQRPRRGEAVDVADLAEVLRTQPVERGAVELGGAADVVVDLRLERLAVGVVPGVLGDVLAVDEHRLGTPVVHLPGQVVAPLQQQDLLPDAASVWASVPPPAPLPMMITS